MRILGLDLGTQSSSFALFNQGKVTVLPLDSNVSTPSLVLHEPTGQVLVGQEAAIKGQQNPQDCYTSILKLLGARQSDLKGKHCLQNLALAPASHTKENALRQNLSLPKALEPELWVDEGYQLRAPSFVVAELLKRFFKQAADSVAVPIDKLVITCPNYFNAQQRQAILDAVTLANLPCPCSLVSENTAHALYFGHTLFTQLKRQKSNLNDCLVLMYNWSSSKFECSLVALNYNCAAPNPQANVQSNTQTSSSQFASSQETFGAGADCRSELEDDTGRGMVEILATLAKKELGGDELTWAIVDFLVNEFSYRYQVDLSSSKVAMQRLFAAAEQAKIELSKAATTEILVPYITKVKDQDLHLKFVMSQEQLTNAVYKPFIRKTVEACYKCLDMAGLSLDQVSQVLMLGGVCQMPFVSEELRQLMSQRGTRSDLLRFERRESSAYVPKFIALDASLAPGACGAALSCVHPQIELVECLPYAIGVGTGSDMQTILPRFAPLPASESQLLTVLEYARDPLGNMPNLSNLAGLGNLGNISNLGNNTAAFYKRESEVGSDGSLKGTVTVCLSQGKCLLAELTLPHVTLVAQEVPIRRRMGGLFMSENLGVAQVKLTLQVELEQKIVVSLTDVNNPSVSQSWVLPVSTLSSLEIARMQQELELRYLVDAKTQQVKKMSELSTPELLSYVDNHPELQPFLTKLNVGLPQDRAASLTATTQALGKMQSQSDSQVQGLAKASSLSAVQSSAQPAAQYRATTKVGQSALEQTGADAALVQNAASKADKTGDLSELSLEILGQAVSQSFGEKITEILRKATSDLSSYHECNQALEDLKDLLKVSLQELTKFKQKSDQELTKTKKFAIEGILNDLLPVYDALDQAVLFGKERDIDAAILQGQTQTLDLFTRTLQQHGVLVEDPTGKLFDPKFHQAISLIESTEVAPKHVAKTLQKGWILNERVVRPAQVIVAKAPEASANTQEHSQPSQSAQGNQSGQSAPGARVNQAPQANQSNSSVVAPSATGGTQTKSTVSTSDSNSVSGGGLVSGSGLGSGSTSTSGSALASANDTASTLSAALSSTKVKQAPVKA